LILVLLIWALTFFIFITIGTVIIIFINWIGKAKNDTPVIELEEAYITGFLSISIILGYLSIWIPINSILLAVISLISVVIFILYFSCIKNTLINYFVSLRTLGKWERIILFFMIFMILTAVVLKITWWDTQMYHAQSIQWIRKYSVVPGLGNLHDGLAFNSMFFIIAAAFAFKIKDILIFPLNGLCYAILLARLVILYNQEYRLGVNWKSLFYALVAFVTLLFMLPNLNTPSPDFICATLIIYVFVQLFKNDKGWHLDREKFILLNLIIVSCIGFKLSSLFFIFIVLFLLGKNFVKESLITLSIIIIVLTPFLVRNYYLSGYLIYPYPYIDFFNPDWKVPYDNAVETKSIIEAWARIPVIPYPDVLKMSFTEWAPQWFKQLSFNDKLLVIVNLMSVVSFIIMLIKKEFHLVKIQAIILLNLVFWFVKAPDTRFAYGFIFTGFSLTIAYMLKLFEFNKIKNSALLIRIGLLAVLIIIAGRRISLPFETLKTPARWIVPAQFGPVEIQVVNKNFLCRIPVKDEGCYYTEIPCTTYLRENLVQRGNDLHYGFKIISDKRTDGNN
jgi:hypothetical protein